MAAKKKASTPRVFRSDSEKIAAVEALNERGDRSAKDVAEALGISPALLYNWRDRIAKGELRAPPTNKADAELQREVSGHQLTVVRDADEPAVVRGRSYAINIEAELRSVPDPKAEVAVLRAENERLKDLIEALVSAATGRRTGATN